MSVKDAVDAVRMNRYGVRDAIDHPLAQPANARAAEPTIGEATQMIFASEDLFRGIRMISEAELAAWLNAEPRLERRRVIQALLGCRKAMR